MIRFAYTILYVKDVTRTIEFYEKAFKFKRKFIAESGDYGELSTGDTTLSFAKHDFINNQLHGGFVESRISTPPLGMEIAFTTDDVDSFFDAAIKAGAKEIKRAETKPWGQTVAYVRDIDGFLIEICTPMQ
jgi:lactoylglutathione lyase